MLAKLVALIHSKVALAVVGVALVSGGGTAVAVAATGGHVPLISSIATTTKTSTTDTQNTTNNHAHTVAVEGVLKGYDAGAHTLSIQTKDATTPTAVSVNGDTRVSGEHATSLADLAKNIGHSVQVQADKQSDGSLLAWKVTVQGANKSDNAGNGNSNGDTHGNGQGAGSGQGAGQGSGDDHGPATTGDENSQRVVSGTIASVGGTSFEVTLESGGTATVSVTSSTHYAGVVHSLADLKTGMRVTAGGSAQADGGVIATVVEVDANA